jgi:hypothetical protein
MRQVPVPSESKNQGKQKENLSRRSSQPVQRTHWKETSRGIAIGAMSSDMISNVVFPAKEAQDKEHIFGGMPQLLAKARR